MRLPNISAPLILSYKLVDGGKAVPRQTDSKNWLAA